MPCVVLDQTADTNYQELHQYAQRYTLPEYVKQASPTDVLSPQGLPTTCYADSVHRQFPCHTKAACFTSWIYFLEKQAQIAGQFRPLIQSRLTQYAQHWGIEPDVRELQVKHAAAYKESTDSLPDSSFAIVWASADGRKDRRYPLRNPAEVKAAADWFAQYRDQLVSQDRRTIATKITEKAAQFGTFLAPELDDLLERHTGRGVYDPREAATMLRNRVKAAGAKGPIAEGLMKLADTLEQNPAIATDPSTTANLVDTIDRFDRNHKLAGNYSENIPRPEDVLYKGTLKTASQFVKDACTLTTGAVYQRQQFSKLAIQDVRDLLGDEIAEAVSNGLLVDPEKMATVASTLPRNDAVTLERLMSDNGERPVLKQAAADNLSVDTRQSLAQRYRKMMRA